MPRSSTYENATHRISQSRKWITILFTDIVDSTRHWQEMGDIETRYRIEQHNQNLLPLVGAHGGEVVKTIGDSIMASFSEPENAVRSAIAMQHALHEIREKDPDFQLKVRIGIHRGKALVEDDDVYGNTVNVAARVEDEAQGDEILISDSVVQYLDQERYFLSRRGSFTPRGKTNSILLYRVSWWRTESMLDCVPKRHSGPRLRRLLELMFYPVCTATALLVGAAAIAPTLLQSRPGWQSLVLNPQWAVENDPQSSLGAALLLVATLAAPLLIRAAREEWLLLLRGAVAFAAGFGMIQLVAYSTPIHWPGEFRHVLETAGQSLVEIREPDLVLHNTPSRDAPVVAVTFPGQRLPLAQTAKTRSAESWLRVAVAPGQFGWLAAEETGAGRAATHQIVPARYGVLEALDLYATLWGVVLSLAVFVRPRPGNARPRSASV
ncbi:MAG: adenylate/guanylate cyclase domain-containing protein [Myxococcales bacterium]|nr:adenylate/guanylate cyclase domain-containing protein [Myxococcales bacterium]